MIGIVVVSHSPALAHAAVDLALQMAGPAPPPLRIAAGTSDGSTGTDAVAIAAAIDEVAGTEGALVLMDLGSAVLSAQLALEFIATAAPVRLSPAPFAEGLVAAVVISSTGAGIDDLDREVRGALEAKRIQLADAGDRLSDSADPGVSGGDAAAQSAHSEAAPHPTGSTALFFDAVVVNASGLHARPAASFVRTVGRYDATVEVSDLDSAVGPVSGASLVSLMSLGVTTGTRVRVAATGPQAAESLVELRKMIEAGFGEE